MVAVVVGMATAMVVAMEAAVVVAVVVVLVDWGAGVLHAAQARDTSCTTQPAVLCCSFLFLSCQACGCLPPPSRGLSPLHYIPLVHIYTEPHVSPRYKSLSTLPLTPPLPPPRRPRRWHGHGSCAAHHGHPHRTQ